MVSQKSSATSYTNLYSISNDTYFVVSFKRILTLHRGSNSEVASDIVHTNTPTSLAAAPCKDFISLNFVVNHLGTEPLPIQKAVKKNSSEINSCFTCGIQTQLSLLSPRPFFSLQPASMPCVAHIIIWC